VSQFKVVFLGHLILTDEHPNDFMDTRTLIDDAHRFGSLSILLSEQYGFFWLFYEKKRQLIKKTSFLILYVNYFLTPDMINNQWSILSEPLDSAVLITRGLYPPSGAQRSLRGSSGVPQGSYTGPLEKVEGFSFLLAPETPVRRDLDVASHLQCRRIITSNRGKSLEGLFGSKWTHAQLPGVRMGRNLGSPSQLTSTKHSIKPSSNQGIDFVVDHVDYVRFYYEPPGFCRVAKPTEWRLFSGEQIFLNAIRRFFKWSELCVEANSWSLFFFASRLKVVGSFDSVRPIKRSSNQTFDQSNVCPIRRSTNQMFVQSDVCSIKRSTNQAIDFVDDHVDYVRFYLSWE